MQPDTSRSQGFTLIELMIVVAIVGILAAIAIPNFKNMLLRSRRAELPANLDGIRLTEKAYEAEWGNFTSCSTLPVTVPGRVSAAFGADQSTSLDWNMLGWVPDGRVRGQYGVVADNSGVIVEFLATAGSDVDGDGTLAIMEASEVLKPWMTTSNNIY